MKPTTKKASKVKAVKSKAKTAKPKAVAKAPKLDGYLTNCSYTRERLDDKAYKKTQLILEKWTPNSNARENTCGNISSHVSFNSTTKKATWANAPHKDLDFFDKIQIYQAIPSALLLYRLIGLWPLPINTYGQEGYKVTWETGLTHVATGEVLAFGEWKGGAEFFHKGVPTNKEFIKDMLELLTLLVSDSCPHPYDGVVSGSVA